MVQTFCAQHRAITNPCYCFFFCLWCRSLASDAQSSINLQETRIFLLLLFSFKCMTSFLFLSRGNLTQPNWHTALEPCLHVMHRMHSEQHSNCTQHKKVFYLKKPWRLKKKTFAICNAAIWIFIVHIDRQRQNAISVIWTKSVLQIAKLNIYHSPCTVRAAQCKCNIRCEQFALASVQH